MFDFVFNFCVIIQDAVVIVEESVDADVINVVQTKEILEIHNLHPVPPVPVHQPRPELTGHVK